MSLWSALGWLLTALLFFWAVGGYSRMMKLRQAIGTAFAQLDALLQQRATVCERLVALLRPALPNEQASFEALLSAQSETLSAVQAVRAKPYAADPVASLAVAIALQASTVTRLLALIEYQADLREQPELQAQVEELKLLERQRAFSRQLFNQAVNTYNEAIQQFPTRVLASFFGFKDARSL